MVIRRAHAAARDDGFTLAEVLVSLAVLGVVLTAGVAFLVNAMKTVHAQADRETAAHLAAGVIAQAVERPLPADALSPTGETQPRDVAGVRYYVTTRGAACWQANPAAACAPTRTTGAVPFVRVEVDVSWVPGQCAPATCERAAVLVDSPAADVSGAGLEPA